MSTSTSDSGFKLKRLGNVTYNTITVTVLPFEGSSESEILELGGIPTSKYKKIEGCSGEDAGECVSQDLNEPISVPVITGTGNAAYMQGLKLTMSFYKDPKGRVVSSTNYLFF